MSVLEFIEIPKQELSPPLRLGQLINHRGHRGTEIYNFLIKILCDLCASVVLLSR